MTFVGCTGDARRVPKAELPGCSVGRGKEGILNWQRKNRSGLWLLIWTARTLHGHAALSDRNRQAMEAGRGGRDPDGPGDGAREKIHPAVSDGAAVHPLCDHLKRRRGVGPARKQTGVRQPDPDGDRPARAARLRIRQFRTVSFAAAPGPRGKCAVLPCHAPPPHR